MVRREDAIHSQADPLWSALAWLGSFGMGLSLFMFLARSIHFEYHAFQDIIATPAFMLYPEQQDWWLYIIAMLIVPAATFVGHYVWSGLSLRLGRLGGSSGRRDFVFVTLTYIFWLIDPVAYLVVNRTGTMPIFAIALFFVVSNLIYITYCWLRHQAQSDVAKTPPDFTMWVAVLVMGGMIGVSFIVSPFLDGLAHRPFVTVLTTAMGTLVIWILSSHYLSKMRQEPWPSVAERLAMAIIPLSALPLQSMFWLDVYQDGIRVSRTVSWWAVAILIVGVIMGSVTLAWIGLRSNRPKSCRSSDFWRWFFYLVVPILLYVMAYAPNIHGAVDLFHEGERVSPAQAILSGQVPYRDVVFVHGFLYDPGVAIVSFRLLDDSIASMRIVMQLLAPLVIMAIYYLVLVCSNGRWASLYALLTLVGILPYYDWRIFPGLVATICMILYIRRKDLLWLTSAGLSTLLALATSFDVGVISLFADGVFLLVYSMREQPDLIIKRFVSYSLPLALGAAVVLIYFARLDALGAFINWHWQVLSVYRDWNGLPFTLTWDGFIEARNIISSPLISVIAIVVLLRAALRKHWTWLHWVSLLLLLFNLTLFNRGVVRGLEGGGAALIAPMLLLTLSIPYLQRIGHKTDWKVLIAAVFSLILLLPISIQRKDDASLFAVVNDLPAKNRITVPVDWVQSDIDRVGPIYIPVNQEQLLNSLTEFLSNVDSFWDFADHGALFFLSDHLSPTRFYTTHHVITGQDQREVIADLKRHQPSYILYRSHTFWDAIAGVDRNLRNFLVAEYLLREYKPAGQVAGFDLLERGSPQTFPVGTPFKIDLGGVPFLWGRDRLATLDATSSTPVAQWNASLGNLTDWHIINDIAAAEVRQSGLFFRTAGSDPHLQNLDLTIDPRSVTYLVLRLTVQENHEETLTGQIFWRSSTASFTEEQSVTFSLIPDGKERVYLIRLASIPGWMWSDTITGIRLDPGAMSEIDMTIGAIDLISVIE